MLGEFGFVIEGLQIQQLQIQICPTPPRKTTFNRQNGEHHERTTHNRKRPDDEHNREILHIPGNKNEQPNKRQNDSPTKHLIRNYSPIRNPQRAPNCTRPPSQPPIPTLSNSTQSERKQTSVMCNTKHYDRPIGQLPEPLQKLRNNHIKDRHSRNLRESKIVQLIHKTTHHRRRSYTPQPPAIQNNKTPRPQ